MRRTQRKRRLLRLRSGKGFRWIRRWRRCRTPEGRQVVQAHMERSSVGRAILDYWAYSLVDIPITVMRELLAWRSPKEL